MHTLISKTAIALGLWLISSYWLSGASAQKPIDVIVLNLRLTCDADQCRTPVLEIREDTSVGANSSFAPPSGISLDERHTTGVEVDGGGEDHYVRPEGAGSNWVKCKWLAKAHIGGNNGPTKGYCWIGIKK